MNADHHVAIAVIGADGEVNADALEEIDDAGLVASSCRVKSKGQAFCHRDGYAWCRY